MARKLTGPIDLLPPQNLRIGESWEPALIQQAITRRTARGKKPTFLFLGNREVETFRRFLKSGWGDAAVGAKSSRYYLGLEIIEVDVPTLARIGGNSSFNKLSSRGRRPDDSSASVWQLKIGA